MDYKSILDLMAEYFLNTQEAQCLLCDNHMKNFTIDKQGSQGCDGNCRHNKKYGKDDLIEIFINSSRRVKLERF